jgi:hypothetical protein
MGLLKHLLFWPVTGPEFLVKFSLGKVEETMRQELTDDQSVKEDLLALQMQLELGEIDDEEYVEREAELMLRLREVRQWREEFGMGIAGGPVRVAGSGGAVEAPGDVQETDAGEEPPPRGGIASGDGASVELDLGWDAR